MEYIYPNKLKKGDHVRVIAPSNSFAPSFTDKMKKQAEGIFHDLGLKVSYGNYVYEYNNFKTASIEHRLHDLHEAFEDDSISCIIPVRGGSSSNQLLKYIDYELIKKNPKILCGLSDITALSYAITAQTGVLTYYGPHFTMLGAGRLMNYSKDYMDKVFFSKDPFQIKSSEYYSNNEHEDDLILNNGFWTIQEGETEGICFGGNLLTTNFMLGSEYAPDMNDSILFLEENHIIDYRGVQNEVQAILNQPWIKKVRGILFGRFQRETKMTRELLTEIVRSKKELKDVPIVGNVEFGHTVPVATLPIGGKMKFVAKEGDKIEIKVLQH